VGVIGGQSLDGKFKFLIVDIDTSEDNNDDGNSGCHDEYDDVKI